MTGLPWAKILSMLMPIIALLLGGVAAGNVQAIQYGAVDGSAGNWGVTGVAGMGSLLSLATGLFTAWRATGKVNPSRAAEIAALATLAATCMARGDGEGNRLVSLLAEHFAVQSGDKKPAENTDGPIESLHDLIQKLTQRARVEAAEAVAKGS